MTDQPDRPDVAQLLADRMAQIARSAHQSNLARVDQLESLIDSGLDPQRRTEAADVAHKLAGSAGTFGYTRVSDRARDLELSLDPDHAAGAAAETDRLRGWVTELRELLAEEPDEID